MALCYHVEFVALFSFLDHAGSSIEFLLFQDVAQLLFLVGVDFRKDRNPGKDFSELLSSSVGSILHDVLKSLPVQPIDGTHDLAFDGGCSRSVVHESEFSERLS